MQQCVDLRRHERVSLAAQRGPGERLKAQHRVRRCLRATEQCRQSCPSCGLQIDADEALTEVLITNLPSAVDLIPTPAEPGTWTPFVDGDDINRRYRAVHPTKQMRLDIPDWP